MNHRLQIALSFHRSGRLRDAGTKVERGACGPNSWRLLDFTRLDFPNGGVSRASVRHQRAVGAEGDSADADFFMLRFEGLSTGEIGIRTADAHFLGFAHGRVVYPFSFGRHSGGPPPDGVCRFIQFPHWALACLTGILPLRAGWRAFRTRRVSARGRCRNCGYDLRATPERCPECGTGVTR